MLKIMVVEDNAVVGLDICVMLQDWGYVVDGPHTALEEALAAIPRFEPDGVLLDIDLDDHKTSEPVAQQLNERGTPFICLTGFSSSIHHNESVFANASRLDKPVAPDELRAAVERVFGPSRGSGAT